MDFEEWFKDHRYSDTPLCYGAAKDGFKAGQQSKQAEIDALNDKINKITRMVYNETEDYHLDEKIKEILHDT